MEDGSTVDVRVVPALHQNAPLHIRCTDDTIEPLMNKTRVEHAPAAFVPDSRHITVSFKSDSGAIVINCVQQPAQYVDLETGTVGGDRAREHGEGVR